MKILGQPKYNKQKSYTIQSRSGNYSGKEYVDEPGEAEGHIREPYLVKHVALYIYLFFTSTK